MDKEAFHIARCKLELKFEEPKYGPGSLSHPIESWPASRESKQELPAEEVRVKPSILVNIVATGQNKSDVLRFVKSLNKCLATHDGLQKCMNILARILQVQISQKNSSVCLNLLGSTLVKEANYLNVVHNYDTQTILLRYTDDINFRGKLTRIVSDKDPVAGVGAKWNRRRRTS